MTNIFYGKFIDLVFRPSNQKQWLDFTEKYDKKEVWLEIGLEKGKRTLNQNSFMWLYLDHIEKETGNLATDLHELFKRKFLPPVVKKILGVEFKIPASTTDLTKQEMSDYLDKISAFTQIPIPKPIKKEFNIEVVYPINSTNITAF